MAKRLPISLKRSLRYLDMYLRPRQLYETIFKADGETGLDVIIEDLSHIFITAKEMRILERQINAVKNYKQSM